MSARRHVGYQRLVRWYPRKWRGENAAVFLDTLEAQALDEGRTGPSRVEVWSIRAHGLTARATPGALAAATAVALALSIAPILSIWVMIPEDQWARGVLIAAPYLGALLTCIAIGGLMIRGGRLAPEPAALAGLIAVPAWIFGALAAASWGVGFSEADAGETRSWLADAFLGFAAAALTLGAVSVGIVIACILRRPAALWARVTIAATTAPLAATVIGLTTLIPSGVVLASAIVLVLTAAPSRSRRPAQARQQSSPQPLTAPARRGLAVGAAVACLVGSGCVAFALTGSVLFPDVGDSTQTMRTGIFAGSLAAIATTLIGSTALYPRIGNAIVWPTVTLIASLGCVAASYASRMDGPWGWPLLLSAAILTGVTGGLLCQPLLPRAIPLRAALIAGISIALAASLGLVAVTTASFAAPVLAAALTIALLRRPRSRQDDRTPAAEH